ncbi:MAG: hypothetical protein VYE42_03530 [Actinomycetota bacterium]|nr:hypothetical protein [Actinomycetota bacterium]
MADIESKTTTRTLEPMRRIVIVDDSGEMSVTIIGDSLVDFPFAIGSVIAVEGRRGSKGPATIIASSIEDKSNDALSEWFASQGQQLHVNKRMRPEVRNVNIREIGDIPFNERVKLVAVVQSVGILPIAVSDDRVKHTMTIVDESNTVADLTLFCATDTSVDVQIGSIVNVVANVKSYGGRTLACGAIDVVRTGDRFDSLTAWWKSVMSDEDAFSKKLDYLNEMNPEPPVASTSAAFDDE